MFFGRWSDYHLDTLTNYTLEQIAAYVFAVDAVNFCFWPRNPSGQFEYEHMTRGFERVLKETPEFFSTGLGTTTPQFLREAVFTTTEEFALLDERARLLQEVGKLAPDGFMHFIAKSGFDCARLVDLITDTLPGFRD